MKIIKKLIYWIITRLFNNILKVKEQKEFFHNFDYIFLIIIYMLFYNFFSSIYLFYLKKWIIRVKLILL